MLKPVRSKISSRMSVSLSLRNDDKKSMIDIYNLNHCDRWCGKYGDVRHNFRLYVPVYVRDKPYNLISTGVW